MGANKKKNKNKNTKCPTLQENMIVERRLVTGIGKDWSKLRKTTKQPDRQEISRRLSQPSLARIQILQVSSIQTGSTSHGRRRRIVIKTSVIRGKTVLYFR